MTSGYAILAIIGGIAMGFFLSNRDEKLLRYATAIIIADIIAVGAIGVTSLITGGS